MSAVSTIGLASDTSPVDERPYHTFLESIQTRFHALTARRLREESGQPLFTTDVDGNELWDLYLRNIAPDRRQHHNCGCCRQFVGRFGNLVAITDTGSVESVIWGAEAVPPELREATYALQMAVERPTVSGVFLSSDKCWGTPRTPDPKSGTTWQHFALVPDKSQIYRAAPLTAGQKMADYREDFRCLQLALTEFTSQALEQAKTILEADALSRSEKFLGVVTWLQDRQKEQKIKNQKHRHNLLWRAVASAPAGFCKPRASMVGSLLEDLKDGLPFEDVKRRFNAKMHPLQYQRPQAPPTAGNIKQAEELFAKLGLAAALLRRFATVADVLKWEWQPSVPQHAPIGAGVFGHLQPKGKEATAAGLNLPEQTMTWVKFRDTVLAQAERLELLIPRTPADFCAYATANDPEAPPILQWDREEARNQVSLYVYSGGSLASRWKLAAGEWGSVVGITRRPEQWQEGFAYRSEGILFVLEGARDTCCRELSLFPETLKSELHSVRATIEAHSKSSKLLDTDGQLASGITYSKGQPWTDCRLRVSSRGCTALYRLDRWD